ncbi:hypothetical protein ACLKMY_21175 [Paraburkholderia mimosarum]|uniref:hypothetical protein n=1 Tax=Paraburkholderia mimosarum TaxID=312026 RepID=UPI0039C259FD
MVTNTVELHRRFHAWDKDSSAEPRYSWPGFEEHLLAWQDLHKRRRVVILAEAGSGKTVELRRQAEVLKGQGAFAFYATLKDVARDGLDDVVSDTDRNQLRLWRDGDAPAWFFIDSIDEAKDEKVRLEQALRQIAKAISGHDDRAFIVLSGRLTEWEFERDLERLQEVLPIPEPQLPPPPELRTLVRRLLRLEKSPELPTKEEPLIVLMAALDDEQMRLYCTVKGVTDVHAFLGALRRANLEETARRPLDLDWLVQYWATRGRIGTFADMVGEGLRERIQETDIDRGRHATLSDDKAMQGLERVGAALVFGRKRTILIPDSGSRGATIPDALDIGAILPDWTAGERAALLNRAVFDPAAYGRVRLHNDNEGVVSSFLAARWLRRLRDANLSARQLHGLLFARNYDIDVVKPSMQETAAWVSLWDRAGVARELIRRSPAVLLTAGDPASLSSAIRVEVLNALTARMIAGEESPSLNQANAVRFAQPDIAPVLRRLWETHPENAQIRSLVLSLISAGALRECADIALSVACDPGSDSTTLVLAGEALMAAGNDAQRRIYAEHIKHHRDTVPTIVLETAIEGLFPDYIGVDDVIAMFAAGVLDDETGSSYHLKYTCPELVKRIANLGDLERLLRGLLDLTRSEIFPEGRIPGEGDNTLERFLAAAADHMLELSSSDSAQDAAIDAVLLFCSHLGVPFVSDNEKVSAAAQRLRESAPRRRAAFWRAAQTLSTHGTENGPRPKSVPEMANAGWNPRLHFDDMDWLLEDGPQRQSTGEQRLAASAAIELWREEGERSEVLARIKGTAATCVAMQAEVNRCLKPVTVSPEYEEQARRRNESMAAIEQRREHEISEKVAFVESLRSEPDPVRTLLSTTPGAISDAMRQLWNLLREANRGCSRLAAESVEPLAEIAGKKVANAFVDVARQLWREYPPEPKSARAPAQRSLIWTMDGLGPSAIGIEAASDPAWANQLSSEEATRATEYATLEINALPPWIADLANKWPQAVQNVLMAEVRFELNIATEGTQQLLLARIASGPEPLLAVIALPIWSEVESRQGLAAGPLQTLLSIVRRGMPTDMLLHAYTLAIARFNSAEDSAIAAQYLGFAAAIDAPGAIQALVTRLGSLDSTTGTDLVARVLPVIFGSRADLSRGNAPSLDVATLRRLVVIAYGVLPADTENGRMDGRNRPPEILAVARDASSICFELLVNTPGRETFDALKSLEREPEFSVPASRLEALALERAAIDSEMAEWAGGDALLFERRWEKAPVTGSELQMLMLERLEDLQHDLLHADFAQGPTLSALPDEAAVQSWVADRLRLAQGWSYSVEREPETVDAKKPDIVVTARASTAKLPLEIKVAESWTIEQLEAALEVQLCGQYLRARGSREGLLIVVHKKPRPVGWQGADGTFMTFKEVSDHLKTRALQLSQASPGGPQPAVAVIDVSGCASNARRRASNRNPAQKTRGSSVIPRIKSAERSAVQGSKDK